MKRTNLAAVKSKANRLLALDEALLTDVRKLILSARQSAAATVNATMTLLYWEVGTRVRQDILANKRAEYGAQIVHALSAQLDVEFGRGFGEKNLRRMVQFAEVYPDREIVAALLRQLGWTHFTMPIPLDDPLKRKRQ